MSASVSPEQRAFVFPGQGSQSLGMGRELAQAFPAAKAVFEEVDEALGQDLSGLIWGEDMEALTLTENAQPALMAVSLAAVRALESQGYALTAEGSFVAGHSLGEYSALAAAGVLSLADCARLLRLRGQAMQVAVPVGQGAMAAVVGLNPQQLAALAEQAAAESGEVCAFANDNAPGQGVISGTAAAVELAIEKASAAGAKRALRLKVSAPFHCALMGPAAETMRAALDETQLGSFALPLIANVTATAYSDPAQTSALLVEQVTSRVRWTESLVYAADQGITQVVELGAGSVLSGLARRINPRLSAVPAGTPEALEALDRTQVAKR